MYHIAVQKTYNIRLVTLSREKPTNLTVLWKSVPQCGIVIGEMKGYVMRRRLEQFVPGAKEEFDPMSGEKE
jgi:hypothetical protein